MALCSFAVVVMAKAVVGGVFMVVAAFMVVRFSDAGNSEVGILLDFRRDIGDPHGFLADWIPAAASPCRFNGVTCTVNGFVAAIDLHAMNLTGSFSGAVCGLPELTELNLGCNSLNQTIPLEISRCRSLTVFNISRNTVWGTLPMQISEMVSLRVLDLSGMYLEGRIPPGIGGLSRLEVLNLGGNLFIGDVGVEIGSLTELRVLDLSQNNLTGNIPAELMKLQKLAYLHLYDNGLSGEIPATIWNLTSLKQLDLGKNEFTGKIPDGISELHDLEVLMLYMNQLTGPVPPGIVNLKKLSQVMLHTNLLTGTLPLEVGLNASFTAFDISLNNIRGSIPPNLCHGGRLQNLSLHTNHFSGQVPEPYGACHSLVRLTLQNNELTGKFPSGLWAAPTLNIVRLENNKISGTIPPEIHQASQLAQIQIDNNQFTGVFPQELSSLPSLYKLSASQNKFSGNFPPSICNCPVLSIINVSQNLLSGELSEFSSCKKLVSISFAQNKLQGKIPPTLGSLPVLTYLDLSSNNLTGPIPAQLANLKLVLLNLSFNRLSGRVPASLISSLPASYLEGNLGLCGTGLSRPCTSEYLNHSNQRHKHPTVLIWTLITVFIAAGVIFFLGLVLIHRSCNRIGYSHGKPTWNTTSFCHLGFNEDDIVWRLDEKNVVGSGVSGKVYKVLLPSGEPVAVKRLWKTGKVGGKQGSSLKAEIETLGKVCHRNIVKLLCCSSSEEITLLVYEYVPNGSLADVLHSPDFVLDWPVRFNIAIGAARGLAYLHHDYVPQVLHRDIKSSNILLDSDYEPKLADSGLAKILGDPTHLQSVSSVVGSYGYVAPEYAYTAKVNEKIDVYGFGVVLLELITGRKAVEMEQDDLIDVVKWVRGKVNTKDGIWKVLDPKIREKSEQEMVSVLKVALLCTSVLPQRRPSMQEVVEMLQPVNPDTSSKPTIHLCANLFYCSSPPSKSSS